MPLVGTNFYGTQVQRTPWDDAEEQRARGVDAWNMAQNQNDWQDRRFQQGRGDAWAMNRDNLNFNTYALDRGDARSAAALAAQERLTKMQQDFEAGLLDKKHGYSTEDAKTAHDQQLDIWRKTQEPYQKRSLDQLDLANKIAQENADYNRSERQRAEDKRKAMQAFWQGTPASADVANGKPVVAAVPGFMARAANGEFKTKADLTNALLQAPDPDLAMGLLPQLMGQLDIQEQHQADRILMDLQSNDPALRKRGLEAQGTASAGVKARLGPARAASELTPIDPNLLPQAERQALQQGAERVAQGANAAHVGSSAADTWDTPEAIQQHVDTLRERVLSTAAASGVDPSRVWTKIKASLDTGGPSWQVGRLFGLIDSSTQDANEAAIQALDREFGGF